MSTPVVLSVFATFAMGGPQVRFAALANRFGARWRHVVIAMDGRYDAMERIASDVPLLREPSPIGKGEGAAGVLRLRRALRRIAPDVLVTSNWGSIEWALANLLPPRIRHIHMEDGFGPDEARGQQPRRVLARRLILRRSEIVLPSRTLLAAARDLWRLPQRRLHYIPNGLDLHRFEAGLADAALLPPGHGPVIGTVAKLRAEKNIGRLLEAVAMLRTEGLPARVLVVGDGPEQAGLEAQARALGLGDVTLFAGHRPDPAPCYRAMDVFALSSDTEQMPFSVLEAMASRLPVASTDVGDVQTMVAVENSDLVAGSDAATLAASLRILLTDPARRRALGEANRAKAERDYDQEAMFQAYARLIEPGG